VAQGVARAKEPLQILGYLRFLLFKSGFPQKTTKGTKGEDCGGSERAAHDQNSVYDLKIAIGSSKFNSLK